MEKANEIHFEDKHPDSTIRLPEKKREEFHLRMKRVVVLISVNNKRSIGDDEPSQGGGVMINETGLILTCAHLFDKYEEKDDYTFLNKIKINVFDHNGTLHEADIVDINRAADLGLIQLNNDQHTSYDFGKLHDRNAELGMGKEVICISHSGPGYSMDIGFVSYAREKLLEEVFNPVPEYMDPKLPVLHISNILSQGGTSGCPIFDTCGRIVAIVARGSPPYSMPVTLSSICSFLDSYYLYGSSWDR